MTDILLPASLMTGIGELDGQHDHLFQEMQLVKNAFLSVSEDEDADYAHGILLLTHLSESLAEHFAWEARMAQEHGIPFAEHAKEHVRMSNFVRRKIGEILYDRSSISALMVFMERMFESHVSHFDLALGQALKAAHKDL